LLNRLGGLHDLVARPIEELRDLQPWHIEKWRATQIARGPGVGEQATPSTSDLAVLILGRLNDDRGASVLFLPHR
jgi:hypothetical protein